MRRQIKTIRRQAEAGFTLVELMVVVAIIGILAAVAGPRIQAFRAKGVQAEAKSNLHSIYLAMIAFEDGNDKFAASATCPATGGACGELTHTSRSDDSYKYGWVSDNDRFLAGAFSKRKLLKGRNDQWSVNTNKALCSVLDSTVDADAGGAKQKALRTNCEKVRGAAVALNDTGAPSTALGTEDDKQ
jgi:prepilin-type N-terminal cleavage/methylation domain-containing protein